MTKCKVSKFIKVPFIEVKQSKPPECVRESKSPLPLYTITRSNHQTIFYAENNTVYFYENLLSSDWKIAPFYDYKSESYQLTKLENIDASFIDSFISHFQAPNGNVYFVYRREQEGVSKSEIVVYNYTKNRFIYRSRSEMLDVDTFKIPIGNSLLVSILLAGCYIWVRVIDVTQEERSLLEKDRGLLRIFLYNYFENIISSMSDSISKTDFRRLSKVANNIYSEIPKDVKYKQIGKMSIMASVHDDSTVFYKGFEIQFDEVNIKSLRTVIKEAFSLYFVLEDNKLVVRLGTGKGGYISIKGKIINVPPGEYWFNGEYVLSNKYNLSKSQLYSVAKVSREYIIIDGLMYRPSPKMSKVYESHIVVSKINYIFEDDDVSIVKDNRYDNKPLAILNFTRSKIGYRTAVYVTQKMNNKISMINIHKLQKRIKQMQANQSGTNLEIIEVPSEFIETIELDKKILEFLSDRYKTMSSADSYNYWYYVDENKGYIYCLVVYNSWSGNKSIILLKYFLKDDNKQPLVMDSLDINSNELQKNSNILVFKTKSIILYRFLKQTHIYELLRYYSYKAIYNYMNEMMIKIKYPLFQLRDVKYNRYKSFMCYSAAFKEIGNIDTDNRYNVVMWYIRGQMGRENRIIRVPFVISDLAITRKADCSTFCS